MNPEQLPGNDGPVSFTPAPVPLTLSQVTKGKLHGSIDVRLSVMSINRKAQRIDLDTEDNIYHLKVTAHRQGQLSTRQEKRGQGWDLCSTVDL